MSALYHLALNQRSNKQYANAIDSFSKIVDSGCNDKCVYEERGKTYLLNEEYQLALKDFEVLVGMD